MRSALALAVCLLPACGGLNEEQLDYLRKDALTRSNAPVTVAALARGAHRYADASTLDASLTAAQNADRIQARLQTLGTCVTVTRRSGTELTAAFKSRCGEGSGTEQAAVYLLAGKVVLTVTAETFEVPVVQLEKELDGSLSFRVERLPQPDEVYSVDTDILSFRGTAEVDPAGVTVNGTGTHEGEIRFALGYRMEHIRVLPGCGAVQGRLTLGPREVMVWQGHTVPVEEILDYGPPGSGTTRILDRSYPEVLVVSSLCPPSAP